MSKLEIALLIAGGIVGLYGLIFADERRSHIWCLCGGLIMGPAFARPLANWLWSDPAHEKCACRRCECRADGKKKPVAAPAGEPGAQEPVVPSAFFRFEGGETVEGHLDSPDSGGAADMVAQDRAPHIAFVDQSGDGDDRCLLVGKVGDAGMPGNMREDGELDVVHGPESNRTLTSCHPMDFEGEEQ